MKIDIQLVPKSSWYSNVRSNVSKSEWDIIRRKVYAKANYKCEICGGVGSKHPVEAHEIWSYNDGIQKLEKIVSLCPACHEVHHIGLAKVRGRFDIAIRHYMCVSNLNYNECMIKVKKAFAIWAKRNKQKWKLDLSELVNYE